MKIENPNQPKLTGVQLIAQERFEQISKHRQHNDHAYCEQELRKAAMYCLTLNIADYPHTFGDWFMLNVIKKKGRMSETEFRIEMNTIAAAFLAADSDVVNGISVTDERHNLITPTEVNERLKQ
jgi:hypothetical protein